MEHCACGAPLQTEEEVRSGICDDCYYEEIDSMEDDLDYGDDCY